MTLEKDCQQFRESYPDSGTASLLDHSAQCMACAQWQQEINEIVAQSSSLAQFDVPEQLTQNILSSVDRERRISARQGHLLLTTSAVCAAVSYFIYPIDDLEGLMSTGVAVCCLVLINLFISKAGLEEGATS